MSVPYIAPARLDAVVNLQTGDSYWLAMHTDDPEGASGLNEGTGVGRVLVDTATWAAIVDHATSGRMSIYDALLDFGTSTAEEVYTWAALWTAETGGTVAQTKPLASPVSVVVGTPLTVPIGNLRMRAFPGS